MWAFAHFAPVNWPLTVAVLILAQGVLLAAVWRLLREVFGRRALIIVPFAYFAFSTLTLPAFTWLSAAILWIPLGLAAAGALRQHTLYLRTLSPRHAWTAFAWLLLGMASFEKVLVLLPYLAAFSFVVVPQLQLRRRSITALLRQTWLLWTGYALLTLAYVAYYLRGAGMSDTDSVFRAPSVAELGDFAYKSLLQAFIPSALGGPWDWTPVSPATAIVSSPVAFDWTMWLVAAVLVVVALTVRRLAARAFISLAVYLVFSILTLAISRVPVVGAVAGLETRYVADAVIPLALTLGVCLMPVLGERSPWLPVLVRFPRAQLERAFRVSALVLAVAVLGLSVRAMGGYAAIHAGNPHRAFVENARLSLATLPESAQVFDVGLPVDVIGPLFLEYNESSRFLAPFATEERRREMYTLTQYTNPYVLNPSGKLVPMTVDGISSPAPMEGLCGWSDDDGEVSVPLSAGVFPFGWTVRVGYLASAPTTAVAHLGDGRRELGLEQGLGEVYFRIEGGGDQLRLTDLDPDVRICVGDVTVGNAVPGQARQ
jgi:hypothetical protein